MPNFDKLNHLGPSRKNQFNVDVLSIFSPFNGDRQLKTDLQYQLKYEYFDPYVNELSNKLECHIIKHPALKLN